MKSLPTLIGVGLKSNFGLSLAKYRLLKQKKDTWMLPLVLLNLLVTGAVVLAR